MEQEIILDAGFVTTAIKLYLTMSDCEYQQILMMKECGSVIIRQMKLDGSGFHLGRLIV